MPYGPCNICGATNYPSSLGGPYICPRCDCGLPPQRPASYGHYGDNALTAPRTALEGVQHRLILANVHGLLRNKYRRKPLWAFVRDICGVGSTTATEICQELGWNPDGDAGGELPGW